MIKENTEKSGRYGTRTAAVGLAKIGTITFNRSAHRMMGFPSHLKIWYEVDSVFGRRLWFEPTNDPSALEVKSNRLNLQYRINSRRFIREYDIPPSDGSPYELKQVGDYFCIEIDDNVFS